MKINLPTLATLGELLQALRGIDISVPGRTDGRTTDHTEAWTICRLLSTLSASGDLKFPVSLQHRDRPDFCLTDAVGQVGIEVTEAIPKQYAAYSALAEREFPGALLEPSHFRWGAPVLSSDEMRALLKKTGVRVHFRLGA